MLKKDPALKIIVWIFILFSLFAVTAWKVEEYMKKDKDSSVCEEHWWMENGVPFKRRGPV